jgi:hypothetical protein
VTIVLIYFKHTVGSSLVRTRRDMDLGIRDMCQQLVTSAAMVERVEGLGFVSGDGRTEQSQSEYDENLSSSRRQVKFCQQNRTICVGNSRNWILGPIRNSPNPVWKFLTVSFRTSVTGWGGHLVV